MRDSSVNIKDYLTPNVGNHSTDNYSLLYDGLEIPEAADTFEPPESSNQSGRNYHVKFNKFNQELKLRKMIEQQNNPVTNTAPAKDNSPNQNSTNKPSPKPSSIPRIRPFTTQMLIKQTQSQKLSPKKEETNRFGFKLRDQSGAPRV